jgi:hypothetical protein
MTKVFVRNDCSDFTNKSVAICFANGSSVSASKSLGNSQKIKYPL